MQRRAERELLGEAVAAGLRAAAHEIPPLLRGSPVTPVLSYLRTYLLLPLQSSSSSSAQLFSFLYRAHPSWGSG